MLARRSGTREALIAALLALAACREGEPPADTASATASSASSTASAASASSRAAPIPAGATAAIDAFARATAALAAWTGCDAGDGGAPSPAAYGALRRALAAAEPFARAGTSRSAEVIFGPPRPSDEGAGAVGALDAALAAHDCAAVKASRFQLESALRLAPHEAVGDRGLGDPRTAQALSDAAYELGLAVLQARLSSSNFEEADRGEVLGLADAIEAGATALWPAPPPAEIARALDDTRAIRAAVERAPSIVSLPDRARLARATGAIGLAIRTAARARGLEVRAPYRAPAGTPDAAVSPLSLPPPRRPIDRALAALGERLFSDPRLSSSGKRSCASCHDPARAFTEPRPVPSSLDPAMPLRRNTPTLLYNGLQATQLWDGRVVTAEVQALRVVHNRAELGLDDAELVTRVRVDPSYSAAFSARPEGAVTASAVGAALGAYVGSLGSGTAPIDTFARGDDAALTVEIGRGLDVFAGRGRCARCHVPPLWGGSRPTDFAVPVYSVLGVPERPEARVLDGDPGRGAVTRLSLDKGAFKTPTVRNIARTAPYLHHGRYTTLEQVIDLYDRGGGRGLGLLVPNQDPDVRPLRLTPEERRSLLVFLREGLLDAR